MNAPDLSWTALLPLLVALGTALTVLLADLWSEGPDRESLGWLGVVGLSVLGAVSLLLWNRHELTIAGTLALDRFAVFFDLFFAFSGVFALLLSMAFFEKQVQQVGEFYALLLFSLFGMLAIAATTDLITIFLSLEILSLAAYVLTGIRRDDPRATEGALKYFVVGAFATGFLLLGVACLYGATGTTLLAPLAEALRSGTSRALVLSGVAFLLVGFGFKLAAVPFHLWAPDAYEGAPTPVTAWMAVAVKAAALAGLLRVLSTALDPLAADWKPLVAGLAAVTMTVGNFLALGQTNVKRLLAYSSIAHAGYLLVGVAALESGGGSALLFHLVAYALMNLGAFAVVVALGERGEVLAGFEGVGFRYPLLGAAMSLFLLSLAGIPPLAGFAGKFYLFAAAVRADYVGLAVLGALNSVLSMYYYAGVLVRMYMREGEPEAEIGGPLAVTLWVMGLGTLLLGVFPAAFHRFAELCFSALG
ncbi:MAG: NADH-quinone oxidoreductase subunit N [Candidatus Binatia bacterium]|nr:MAG: NADH-quinone oxidoreductase subunit N [Candidatus Binatia bacterium]